MANEGEKDWKRRKLDHTADAPTGAESYLCAVCLLSFI